MTLTLSGSILKPDRFVRWFQEHIFRNPTDVQPLGVEISRWRQSPTDALGGQMAEVFLSVNVCLTALFDKTGRKETEGKTIAVTVILLGSISKSNRFIRRLQGPSHRCGCTVRCRVPQLHVEMIARTVWQTGSVFFFFWIVYLFVCLFGNWKYLQGKHANHESHRSLVIFLFEMEAWDRINEKLRFSARSQTRVFLAFFERRTLKNKNKKYI